jgi:hypothetical protein
MINCGFCTAHKGWWSGVGVEPPTFRFSGLRITVQDGPRRAACLLSDLGCTPIDAGACGYTRLGMRLTARWVTCAERQVQTT